jgi:hypothetical protein
MFFFGGDSEGEDDASSPARDLPPGTEEQLFPPSSLGAPSPQDLPPGTVLAIKRHAGLA